MIKAQVYNTTFHMTVSLSYQTNLSKSQTDDPLIYYISSSKASWYFLRVFPPSKTKLQCVLLNFALPKFVTCPCTFYRWFGNLYNWLDLYVEHLVKIYSDPSRTWYLVGKLWNVREVRLTYYLIWVNEKFTKVSKRRFLL